MGYYQCSIRGGTRCPENCPYNTEGYHKGDTLDFSCPAGYPAAEAEPVEWRDVHPWIITICLVAILCCIIAWCFSFWRWNAVSGVEEWAPGEVLQEISRVESMVPQLHLDSAPETVRQFNAAVQSAKTGMKGVDVAGNVAEARQQLDNLNNYFDGSLGWLSHLCWWAADQRAGVAERLAREVAAREKFAETLSPAESGTIALSEKLGKGLAELQSLYQKEGKAYEVLSQEMNKRIEMLRALEGDLVRSDGDTLDMAQNEIDALTTLVARSRGKEGSGQEGCRRLTETAESVFSDFPDGVHGAQAKRILEEVKSYVASVAVLVQQAADLLPRVQAAVGVRKEQLRQWQHAAPAFEVCTHPKLARDLVLPVLRIYMKECGAESVFEMNVDDRIKLCGVLRDGRKLVIDVLTLESFTPLEGTAPPSQVWISGIDIDRTDGAMKASVIAMDAMVPFCEAEQECPEKIGLDFLSSKLPENFSDDYRYKMGDTPEELAVSESVRLIPFSRRAGKNTHFIPVEAVPGRPAIEASSFTIKTENYALTKRIVMYVPHERSEEVSRFDAWMDSDAGLASIAVTPFADQILNLGQGRLGFSFFFAHKSSQLDSKAERDLGRLEALLNRQKEALRDYKIVVVGHASTCGSPESNLKYGMERAVAIQKRLQNKHIPMPVLAYSCGSAEPVLPDRDPVTDEENEKAARRNRRVEIFMVAPDGDITALIGKNAKRSE